MAAAIVPSQRIVLLTLVMTYPDFSRGLFQLEVILLTF